MEIRPKEYRIGKHSRRAALSGPFVHVCPSFPCFAVAWIGVSFCVYSWHKFLGKMWLEECDGFAELCRGYLPYYLLIVLPIFIIISPVDPVTAAHEFPVFRMHQYDLHGVPHGTSNSPFFLKLQLLDKCEFKYLEFDMFTKNLRKRFIKLLVDQIIELLNYKLIWYTDSRMLLINWW